MTTSIQKQCYLCSKEVSHDDNPCSLNTYPAHQECVPDWAESNHVAEDEIPRIFLGYDESLFFKKVAALFVTGGFLLGINAAFGAKAAATAGVGLAIGCLCGPSARTSTAKAVAIAALGILIGIGGAAVELADARTEIRTAKIKALAVTAGVTAAALGALAPRMLRTGLRARAVFWIGVPIASIVGLSTELTSGGITLATTLAALSVAGTAASVFARKCAGI